MTNRNEERRTLGSAVKSESIKNNNPRKLTMFTLLAVETQQNISVCGELSKNPGAREVHNLFGEPFNLIVKNEEEDIDSMMDVISEISQIDGVKDWAVLAGIGNGLTGETVMGMIRSG